MAREVVRVVAALAIGASLLLGYTLYRIAAEGAGDDEHPADAIVVLGAAQYNGVASLVFASRLDHAVDLFKRGVAPWLIVTGGKQPGDRTTEAATAKAYVRARGVPADHILMEDSGRSTLESLTSVAGIMRDHDLRTAVFVSDRTHMLRVMRMASDLGIVGYSSPTASSPTDLDPALRSKALLHELGGLVAYGLGLREPTDETTADTTP